MTAVMPENRVFASEFGSSYCTFPGLHQTVLMPAHGGPEVAYRLSSELSSHTRTNVHLPLTMFEIL